MKLEIYGGPREGGWRAHGEYEADVDPTLKRCPFCGSLDLAVSNSHTPSYQAECYDCGAEGPRCTYVAGRRCSKKTIEAIHRRLFDDAIRAWNSRGYA